MVLLIYTYTDAKYKLALMETLLYRFNSFHLHVLISFRCLSLPAMKKAMSGT